LLVLETDRLELRWLEPGDAGFVHELMNDRAWLEHIGDRGIRSTADARRYIVERMRAQCLRLGFGLNCVTLRDTGMPIGICGLVKRDWLADADLGFAFLQRFRGQGHAFDAGAACLRHARAVLGFARVAAIVSPGNARSIHVLERLGLRFERMITPPEETREVCMYAIDFT
jgi:RimJ/RimL family protein N-acetyltransferase